VYQIRTLVLVPALAAAACDADTAGGRRYENDGTVCLRARGEEVTVMVTFPQCLSDGCDEARNATCTATLAGTSLQVESSVEVFAVKGAEICSGACTFARATCELALSTPAQYEVQHGADRALIEFPIADPVELFGEAGYCSDDDAGGLPLPPR
jgi:hypothetical protein